MAETAEEKRRRLLGLAKQAVSKAYSTGEHSIAQAINAYNEIEKTRNLLHERVEEWYGIYFPELTIGSPEKYTRFVLSAGANKKQATEQQLAEIFGDGSKDLLTWIKNSIGGEPEQGEFAALKAIAGAELELLRTEKEIDAYLKENVPKLMPNVSYLVDYKLAAELLSRAGSLTKLAMMPSGTLQLLGAEKALFRHLRSGSKPPKYGVLFKLKEVTEADRRSRGRIARLFATKLSIAARADAISKRFIGKELREQIDRSLVKIREKEKLPRKPSQWSPSPGRQQRPQGRQQGRPRWQDRRGRR
ncbi:MAG: NOP58 family protein [Candidatus Micrarchaeota archaeon]|nr:NOP58 family protein [Candidatus Micrarchaeota archaeon]